MGRSRRPSAEMVQGWIDQGYGQGVGKDYKPFFHVRDVPSEGKSSEVHSLKIPGRVHMYLSGIEYKHHVLAEYDQTVIDIREQFAFLPWEIPQQIAEVLGVPYPRYPGTKVPIVLTLDIVLTLQKNDETMCLVVSTKESSKVDEKNPKNARTLEKLLIEKVCCKYAGMPRKFSTEKDLPENRVYNLDFLRTNLVAKELNHLTKKIPWFLECFERNWESYKTLNEILDDVSAKMGLDRYNCFMLFGRAVWLRLLPVDLDSEKIYHNNILHRRPSLEDKNFYE